MNFVEEIVAYILDVFKNLVKFFCRVNLTRQSCVKNSQSRHLLQFGTYACNFFNFVIVHYKIES